MSATFSFYSKKDKEQNEEQIILENFYGPPTSCNELGKLGYTLNGFYLANGVTIKTKLNLFSVNLNCRMD